jgi:hypothetical protein
MRKIILLDVDGTLSPYESSDNKWQMAGWDDWDVSTTGFPMRFSNDMMRALLTVTPDIRWLTTWEDLANETLSDYYWDMPPGGFPVYKRTKTPGGVTRDDDGSLGWWKLRWAIKVAQDNPDAHVLWFEDDQEQFNQDDTSPIEFPVNLTMFIPNNKIGITKTMVESAKTLSRPDAV